MRSIEKSGVRLVPLLAGAVGGAYLLPLLAAGVVGSFSRYMADDFCTAAVARALGLIRAEAYWYQGWSGRYAYLLLVDLASLIGPVVAPVLPGLLIVSWLAALAWSLAQLRPWMRMSTPVAVLLATVLIAATLSAIPNLPQSLYWRNSSLTYTMPLVLGSLLAGVALRQTARSGHPAAWLVVLVFAFFAGGFSEIYTALQAALFGLAVLVALVIALRTGRWRTLGPWLAGLIGSAAGLATIALAPGTHSRQSTLAAPPALGWLIANSRLYSGWFVRDAFAQHAPLLLAVAGLCALVAVVASAHPQAPARPRGRWLATALVVLPIVTFGLLLACYSPAFYALLYLPPDRVLIINWFLFIVAAGAWGFAAGWLAAPTLRAAAARWPRLALAVGLALAVLVAAPPVAAVAGTAHSLAAAQSYAATWDSYDRILKAARTEGVSGLTLARQDNPGGIDNFSEDPTFWANQCAAQYYGVQVRAVAPPPPPTAAALAQRTPLDANVGGLARVLGYHLDNTSVRAGGAITVSVYWLPTAESDRPYTVFIHLYDPAGGSLGQFDSYPGQGQYLTTVWILGQPFVDTYRVPVRAGAGSANAKLILGLYDLQTSQRLPVSGADAGAPGQDWVQFGQVRVMP